MKQASIERDSEQKTIKFKGDWTALGAASVARELPKHLAGMPATLRFHLADIEKMDSTGAYLLLRFTQQLQQAGTSVEFIHFQPQHQQIYQQVEHYAPTIQFTRKPPAKPCGWLTDLGEHMVAKVTTGGELMAFLGEIVYSFYRVLGRFNFPGWRGVLLTIEKTGYRSLPIVGLLLFLIGIVLSYQMGLQLKQYGANIYIVGLSGTAIFREFGPLITAIIVAGKTASSFTAEIGSMKINEEIDALKTMGISPTERLVLPKIIGVLIALPLLTIWANLFGTFGAMVMSKNLLQIGFSDFLIRFKHDVSMRNYLLGLSKTPIFAIVIAGVGCFQGFRVAQNAESLGRKTTVSVVQAIFLIIVIDAWFSIMFSWNEL